MNVHKVTLLIIDIDDIGADEVKIVIENVHYPNRCINPDVLKIETVDVGEWSDDHPLNRRDKAQEEIEKIFGDKHA